MEEKGEQGRKRWKERKGGRKRNGHFYSMPGAYFEEH